MDASQTDRGRLSGFHCAVLSDLGSGPRPGHQVLDFGCGTGEEVYRLRKAGFRAFGTDVHADWASCQRRAIDEGLAGPDEQMLRVAHLEPYRIPFAAETFDVVLSDQVFEHVQSYPEAIAEIHRVLKPGGVSLHEFPSRWNPVERHVYVPFAGVLRSRPYLTLWAWLGIRNCFQKGLSFRDVAALNFEYLRARTNYLSGPEIEAEFAERFDDIRFVEELLVKHSAGRLRYLWPAIHRWPFLARLVSMFHTRLLFCRKI